MIHEQRRLKTTLILLSGMGADGSVFREQTSAFTNILVPEWTVPQSGDDLRSYSLRMAESIKVDDACIVGGASFGGIVALELARHLNARGCILIGSVRGPHQLPKRIRFFKSFVPWLGAVPIAWLQRSAGSSIQVIQKTGNQHLANVGHQFSKSNAETIRWSAKEILKWDIHYDDVRIRHIHGERDHVFPVKDVTPDEVVTGGGHVISMTHGPQVNEFIYRQVDELT